MSEQPLPMTYLNDFIFCPVSIYFHAIDNNTDDLLLKGADQLSGTASHEKVDAGQYSFNRSVLQGIYVFSEKYNLYGKIDIFDSKTGVLTERKKKIKTIFDGYVFQLFAQYFALKDMGFEIKQLRLYSMDDNKVYPVALPENNTEMLIKFEQTVRDINEFSFDGFYQSNRLKCERCIYEPLCSFSAKKEN